MAISSENTLTKNDSINKLSIFSDPLNLKVVNIVEYFTKVLNESGYNIQPHSPESLEKLPETSREHKQSICDYYERLLEWIQEIRSSGLEVKDSYTEKALLQKALKHYGFIVGEEFWKAFSNELIIEIYGENMIQLYRSLNFYELTGYSVLDLSIFEWYVLWERPKRIMESMAKESGVVLNSSAGLTEFKIPRHINREIMNTGKTEPFVPRAFLIEFQHIISLKKNFLGKAEGLLCTCRGEFVAEGDEAMNIQFI